MYNTLIRLQLIQEDECGEEHEVEGAPDVMYINKHLCTYILHCTMYRTPSSQFYPRPHLDDRIDPSI